MFLVDPSVGFFSLLNETGTYNEGDAMACVVYPRRVHGSTLLVRNIADVFRWSFCGLFTAYLSEARTHGASCSRWDVDTLAFHA